MATNRKMNRRDFLLRAPALVATIPFGVSALIREPEEDDEFTEVLDAFEERVVYTQEPFNAILDAIRELQDSITKLRKLVHG